MEDVKTLGKGMVPRAGVEPARPFGQRILSPQRNSISMKSSLAGSKSLWLARWNAEPGKKFEKLIPLLPRSTY